tara:strand:- start:1189 stop:1845 length:657 start_codon:yes stop_codon:yes gene_type:complete
MAIKLTMNNLLIFLTAVSPLIITLFLILSSLFHGDVKAIFFLLPLMIIQFLIILSRRLSKNHVNTDVGKYQVKTHALPTHDICSIFELPFQAHKVNPKNLSISLNGSFWGYTISYILASIQAVGGAGGGNTFLIFITVLAMADLTFRYVTRCEGSGLKAGANMISGLFVGGLIGIMMIVMIYPGMGVKGENYYFTFAPPQQKCRVINNKFKCIKKRKT